MIDRAVHGTFSLSSLDDLHAAIHELALDISIEEDITCLTEPIEIAGRLIPNRMAIQPMEGCDGTAEGAPGELTNRRYRRFGAGGAGLLWVEACAVVPEGRANPRQLWIHKGTVDAFAMMLEQARLAAADSMGTKHCPFFVLQLTHSGRYSKPGCDPAPIIAYHDPYLDPTRGISPDQPIISDDELEALEDAYVEAARLAFLAGFDAVDVKACHRYLVNELLAAHTRKGKYGGSYENRTRFLKNIILKIQDNLGKDKVITCRLNIHDAHPYPYGWGMDSSEPTKPNLDEPKRLVRELSEMGITLINMTMGNPYYNPHINRPFDRPIAGGSIPQEHPLVGEERLIKLVRQVREGLPDIKVVGSGYSWLRHLWPHVAAAEIKRGSIQMVGLGRQAFAFPGFAKEIIETGRLDRRHTCITCSSCTQIMRDGGMTGCVPFDSEVYAPIYREGRQNDLEYIRAQASRCWNCFDPRCRDGCPARVDIPKFVCALADGDIERSYMALREQNVLPELCGRTCPSEMQCEGHCIENIFSQNPVPIRKLQSYVSRVARERGLAALHLSAQQTGKRIAVIGGGPAGLACAIELLRLGHSVDIFEKDEIVGGIAATAIPNNRIKQSDFEAELEAILAGIPKDRIKIRKGEGLSKERQLDKFLKEYDAVFLGIGLTGKLTNWEAQSWPLPITEGKFNAAGRLLGVEEAIRFLCLCKKGKVSMPSRVAVIGGGNTAMDAANQAKLLGAHDVYLIYRRSFAEMPAWPAERAQALALGIHFLLLTQPIGYEYDAEGKLIGIKIARTVLQEPDASGRRKPKVVPGSESLLEVDLVLEALGQELSPDIADLIPGVELTQDRLIKVDEHCRTSRSRVYAGGDVVNGGSTVVQAIAEGMRAARTIDQDLRCG
ncbi:MAG: FAD-dependent oxidoreductase [Armatimonadota bacterium]|nr:FAD-dependent oxidoreductase [Armatimonadota bacterium]